MVLFLKGENNHLSVALGFNLALGFNRGDLETQIRFNRFNGLHIIPKPLIGLNAIIPIFGKKLYELGCYFV